MIDRSVTARLARSTALGTVFAFAATLGLSLALAPGAAANPKNGTVVGGSAKIDQSDPKNTKIVQSSDRAAINWQGFDIGAGETTTFLQPSSSSVMLNRVTGSDPSVIAGRLQANGQIILVNQNGITFTRGSQIDVNTLIATPANITDANFMAGRMKFDIPSPVPGATVHNEGTITVAERGLAALVAPGTANSGVISAKLGKVVLGGAETFTLDLYGDGLLAFDVTSKLKGAGALGGGAGAAVSNTGTITAEGGRVLLTADVVDTVVTTAINLGGEISARTAGAAAGTVTADAGAGRLAVTGKIDVSGTRAGEAGGTVVLTGRTVEVLDGTMIDATGRSGGGTVKIGGGFHGTDATLRNADKTYVAGGARIDTSAIENGDGGKVAVWSDGRTVFNGTIAARGGTSGGNGGFVETSSKNVLTVADLAQVDTGAPLGKAGTWLLDPSNIRITQVDAHITNSSPFADDGTSNGTNSTLSVATIGNALKNGDVVITTTPGGQAGAGNIQIDANIVADNTGGGNHSLGLKADGNIVLNANIDFLNATGGASSGNLFLAAGKAITYSSGEIRLAGGQLSMTASTGIGAAGSEVAIRGLTSVAATTATGGIFITNIGSGDVAIASVAGSTISGVAFATVAGVTSTTSGDVSVVNNVGSVTVNQTVSGANVTLKALGTANDLTLAGNVDSGAGIATLQASGAISQTNGAITAGSLAVLAANGASLTRSGNSVGTLAASISGSGQALSYTGTGGFDVGSAGTTDGMTTAGGDVTLVAATGNLTLSQAIATSGGAVSLTATAGAVTENAGGAITAGSLLVVARDTSALTQSGNHVGSLAATITGANKSFSYTDTGGLQLGDIGMDGTFTLTVGGAVTQANGTAMTASGTTITTTTATSVDVSNAGNDFDAGGGSASLTVKGDTAAHNPTSIAVTDTNSLKLGDIATSGVFTLTVGGAVTQTNNKIIIAAGTAITTTAATSVDLSNTGSDFDVGAATAGLSVKGDTGAHNPTSITVIDTNGLRLGDIATSGTFALTVGGAVTQASGKAVTAGRTTITTTVAAAVDLSNAGNDLDTAGGSAALTVKGDSAAHNPTSIAATDANDLQLGDIATSGGLALTAGGAVTQANNKALTIAGTLTVNSTGSVDLTNGGNTIGALGDSQSSGGFALTNGAALPISGAVQETGNGAISLKAIAGDITITGTGSVASNGSVLFDAAAGVALAGNINASGGLVFLRAGNGAVGETTGAIVAGQLALSATDNSSLLAAGNAVDTLAASISGNGNTFSFKNSKGFDVARVTVPSSGNITGTTITGIATVSADVTLTATSGDVTISKGITAQNATLSLAATTGAVTENAGGSISAGQLAVAAQDSSSLTRAGSNTVTTLAATITGANQSFSYANTSALDIGTVGTTSGITTNHGAITVTATTPFTVSQSVASSGGAVTLTGTDFSLAAGTTVNSGGGTQSITATNGTLTLGTGSLLLGTGAISLVADTFVPGVGSQIGGTAAGAGHAQSVAIAPSTNGRSIGLAGATGLLTLSAATLDTILATNVAIGNATSGALTIASLAPAATFAPGTLTLQAGSGSALTITGALVLGTRTLSLNAGTTISQNAGATISAGLLSGSGGTVTLGELNAVAALGPFGNNGAGGFTFTTTQPLTVTGAVDAGAQNLSLTTPGNLTLGASLSATGTVFLNVTGAINQTGGVITAGTLTGNATGGTTLTRANQIQNLDIFTNSGAGGFALTDARALDITGAINAGTQGLALQTTAGTLRLDAGLAAGGIVSLNSADTLTQATGTIAAAALTGSSANGASLLGANAIATLGSFTNTGAGGFAFKTVPPLTVNGAVDGGTQTLSLTTSSTLTLNGTLSAGGTVTLSAGGSISQFAGGITAGTLTGTSFGGAVFLGANQIQTLGGFTNVGVGGLTLHDNGNLATSGAINAGSQSLALDTTGSLSLGTAALSGATGVSLIAGGTISQAAGGAITGPFLTGSSSGGATLIGANQVSSLPGFTNSGGGGFALSNAQALNVTNTVNAGSRNLTLTTTAGALTITAPLIAGGTVSLNAAGTLFQAAGTINAAALAGSAGGGATLGQANAVDALNGFINAGNGGVTINTTHSLALSGTIDAGTAGLSLTTSGNLSLGNAALVSGASVTLTASGAISQDVGGAITAPVLSGSATGGATLFGANQVPTLTGFTNIGSGGFALTDARALHVTGTINAGTQDLALRTTAGALTLDAPLIAGGTASLTSAGLLTQNSGTIAAAGLSGGSVGGATLGAQNVIGTLGPFTNTGPGSFSFNTTTALGVSGAVDAGTQNLALSVSGGLTIGASMSAGGTVSLNIFGPIAQTGGVITAGTLSGFSFGGASFTGANQVQALGPFSNIFGGGFALTNARAVDVTGAVSAGTQNLTLTTTAGALTLDASLSAGGFAALNSAGALTQAAGTISALGLSGGSVGGATLGGANVIGSLGPFTNAGGGGFTFNTLLPLNVTGAIAAGTQDLALTTPGPLTIGASLSAGGTLSLGIAGPIAQTGGIITAGNLTGFSIGGAAFTDANQIQRLGAFTNSGSGGFALTNGRALDVIGTVNAGTQDLTLTTTAGALALDAPLVAGGIVSLTSAGALTQAAGTISAARLSGSSIGGATLGGANAIAALGPFTNTGAGGFAFNTTAPLAVTSAVDAGTQTLLLTTSGALTLGAPLTAGGLVTLTAAGAISELAGTITAPLLTGSSVGGAVLTGANRISTLAGFTNTGAGGIALDTLDALTVSAPVNAGTAGLSLTSGGGLTLNAPLNAGGAVTLAAGGPISQSGGAVITAAVLGGSAVGGIQLTGANQIDQLGPLENDTSGRLAFRNEGALKISGEIENTGRDITIDAKGPLTIGPVYLHADRITLQSTGAITVADTNFGGNSVVVFSGVGKFTQTGTSTFDSGVIAIDLTGASLPALQALPPGSTASVLSGFTLGPQFGSVSLQTIAAPQSALLLLVNSGSITAGPINVRDLGIAGAGGSASISGTINGVSGQLAAPLAFKSGARDNNYQFNDCALGSATCVALPIVRALPPPVSSDVIIVAPARQIDDPSIQRLNFGNEDLF
jgi:fibronectin-binding autotransporter adhesin